jgi:thiol-disulfide isomerase/thioredoxin
MRTWTKTALLLLALGFLGVKAWNHLHIPEFPLAKTRLIQADGKELMPNDIRQPYVLVSFFQSWCGDCVREAPSIRALQEKMGPEKLAVLLISDEEWKKINRFAELSGPGLPFYQSGTPLEDLGIRVFPSTWLLGPDRKILLAKLEGYDWNSAEVHALIKD